MNTNTVALATSKNITNANYIIQRVDGVWSAMGTGFNGDVFDLVMAPNGTVYATGIFTTADGNAALRIASWDGSAWSPLGDGLDDNHGQQIAIAANGDVYVTGFFTAAGNGAANTAYIAKWNGSAWSALATGLSDWGYSTALDASDNLYACGAFGDASGVANTDRIAKWDGSAWSALGTGLDDDAYYVIVTKAGDVIAGGAFHNAGGNAALHIAKFDGSTWSAMGDGLDDVVQGIIEAIDGSIYVAGSFTGGLARWDGTSWTVLGDGLDGGGSVIKQLLDGSIIFGGLFNTAGGMTIADRVALWTGSEYLPLDVDLPGGPTVYAIAARENDDLAIGFTLSGTATTSGVPTTTVTHGGTARAFPTITITRSGGTTAVLEGIRNLTTGKELLFDHALLDGEKIVIGLTPGNKTITTYVGDSTNNALNDLLPGSDFGSFALAPGGNDIALYISETGSPTLAAFIQWQTTYPSIDGATS